MTPDVVFCILSAVNYMVDESVGVSGGHIKEVWFEFEKGEGFNLIRIDELPYG